MSTTPQPRFFWPVTLAASNNSLRVTCDVGGAHTYSGTVAAGTYYDPETLAAALKIGLQTAARTGPVPLGGEIAITVSAAVDGTLTASLNGVDDDSTATLAWAYSAATQACGVLLGFGAADVANTDAPVVDGIVSIVAAAPPVNCWSPGVPPRDDSGDRPYWSRAVAMTAGGQSLAVAHGGTLYERSIKFEFLPAAKVFGATRTLQALLSDPLAVARFRYWPDAATPATYSDLWLMQDAAQDALRAAQCVRLGPAVALYSVALPCGLWVP